MTTFDLFSSVRDGNTDIVRRLLQSKQCRAHLNDRNEWGDTALHLSAEAGNAEICQMLIAAGASVTVRNNRGETCLHRAAVGGHVSSVRAVVGRDQDPDAVNSQNDAGYTALHHAAKHGSRDLIDILVTAGADRMIENNAGETPYMVAHKFQQWEAEKMLLDVDIEHADRAVREMNVKEKDIIRAYLKAVKYANHLESRVRIMLIGDRDSGKTSLKKTIFGEPYDPEEKPSFGIHADSSITRIQFKQYREWVLQPASKADVHRLNLEYTDIVIDFVLNFLQQPRISDDPVDPTALQVEKGHVKTVNFDTMQHIIPETETVIFEDYESIDMPEEQQDPQGEGTGSRLDQLGDGEEEGRADDKNISKLIDKLKDVTGREEEIDQDSIEYDDFDDDRLRRFARAAEERSNPPTAETDTPTEETEPTETTPSDATPPTAQSKTSSSATPGAQPKEESSEITDSMQSKTSLKSQFSISSFPTFRPRAELSRLLVEKVPLETLKRMVFRWPVGDEQHRNTSELASKRLMITVWDISGDPVQQNFTPLFFSNRCLFISTYNLMKQLDDPCETYSTAGVRNYDGSVPTNAEVMEGWIGCATAFTKHTPSEPFQCCANTTILPPLILTCTGIDREEVREHPVHFHEFFGRKSFQSYRKHLVEANAPCALGISNSLESSQVEDYSGHHLLRREIDHIARQMPYARDSIPIQWVKFEQLIYGLQEQKKIILLYDDLAKYVSEHCKISGPLQILPVLSHFHDIGVIVYFYRHPQLSSIVFTKPQWLISALSALITSQPSKWVTGDVQKAFTKLFREGMIDKDMLMLAYRCARMPQRYWYEVIFVLNCMDLICCHPSLHKQKAVYLPCMVVQSIVPPFSPPPESDPAPLLFSAGSATIPAPLFNQLVVRCIRGSRYAPLIRNGQTHFQLNGSHHLVLTRRRTAIEVAVQSNTDQFCTTCQDESARSEHSPHCGNVRHLVGEDTEFMPSDNMATIIRLCNPRSTKSEPHLALPDELATPDAVCPRVLAFVRENLEFLCHCWFPGLKLNLAAEHGDKLVVLDEYWKHNVLKSNTASAHLRVWFS